MLSMEGRGYSDPSGRVVIDTRFKNVFPFRSEPAVVETKKGTGYVDRGENFVHLTPHSEFVAP